MLEYKGKFLTNFIMDSKEVVLYPGDQIEDIDHPVIKSLKAANLLKQVAETKKVKTQKNNS